MINAADFANDDVEDRGNPSRDGQGTPTPEADGAQPQKKRTKVQPARNSKQKARGAAPKANSLVAPYAPMQPILDHECVDPQDIEMITLDSHALITQKHIKDATIVCKGQYTTDFILIFPPALCVLSRCWVLHLGLQE